MATSLEDRVLDNGLGVLDTEPTHIEICEGEPTTYAAATTAQLLGYKSFGTGNVFGAPAASTSPVGRKVTSAAITDGTITTTGTAQWWAATDHANSRLLAHGTLSATQAVTVGNAFTLSAFGITLPNGA